MKVETIERKTNLPDTDKVATIDVRGTLVERNLGGSTQAYVNTEAGIPEEVEQDLYRGFADGKHGLQGSYVKHATALTELIKKFSNDFTRESYENIVDDILDVTKIPETAYQLVNHLHSEDWYTVIISSAPFATVIPVAEELEVDAVYNWREFVFDENGLFVKVNVNQYLAAGKSEIVEYLNSEGIETCHLGDAINDLRASEIADDSLIREDSENLEEFHKRAIEEI